MADILAPRCPLCDQLLTAPRAPRERRGAPDQRLALAPGEDDGMNRKIDEAPVLVRDWYDLYAFDSEAEVVCPDCDEVSPPLGNVFAAAKWEERHSDECPV